MTQEELEKEIDNRIKLHLLPDEDDLSRKAFVRTRIMQLINQHVKEVIGKDEYIDEYSEREAHERNNLREEQRKEAGL